MFFHENIHFALNRQFASTLLAPDFLYKMSVNFGCDVAFLSIFWLRQQTSSLLAPQLSVDSERDREWMERKKSEREMDRY